MSKSCHQLFPAITMLHKQTEILSRFIPVDAVQHVAQIITCNNIHLKINRGRLSKLGDFRPSRNGSLHRISVNGTLNVYAFLLVFLHEFAHLQVWENFNNRVAPHGRQWKECFGELIRDSVNKGLFHPALDGLLVEYSHNIRASGLGSPSLTRALAMFDREQHEDSGQVFLEELPGKTVFMASNGRRFIKEDRLRKRYRCLCLDNNRKYLFHPMAKVVMIENGNAE
jgi:SprT protein